ncbi:MAG: hydrogenase expression/formation protein HypE [Armatimonadetes bacterium]|nr:hydrogenase expression/formation protein HypE [Armatimonadota bacterium]
MREDPAGVSDRIERARQARHGRYLLKEEFITLSHGSGGKASHSLIEGVFVAALRNPLLDRMEDQAVFTVEGARLAFTTDSYVVDPIFFPGGDIGKLAVNGTVNDLATSGADPLYLSLGVILEEGFPLSDLHRIAASIREAADRAGVQVITGDTKVVPRGKADKIFINTAGVGVLRRQGTISLSRARPGDRVLMSGPIGDHGVTVLAARGDLELELEIESDTAPLNGLIRALLDTGVEVHCLKDPTRGGVATALNEIAMHSGVSIALDEINLPVSPEVQGACEILGLDPLYIANEGRLLVIAPPEGVDVLLRTMRNHEFGAGSRIIGEVFTEPQSMVFLRTEIGGTRVVDMLAGDPLPRIC